MPGLRRRLLPGGGSADRGNSWSNHRTRRFHLRRCDTGTGEPPPRAGGGWGRGPCQRRTIVVHISVARTLQLAELTEADALHVVLREQFQDRWIRQAYGVMRADIRIFGIIGAQFRTVEQ